MKTNAARMLDELGIAYELCAYDVDESDLSAQTVARKIGMDAAQVFKTLAGRGDHTGVCLAVVPADAELDLKALASLSANRRVELVALKDLQRITGYVRGAVTALGARKRFPVFADLSLERHPRVSVSAGVRGLQLVLAPKDYLRVTSAVVGSIARAQG